jgi:mannose-6-phosphate isomerase-like protein (cupin superfamily)
MLQDFRFVARSADFSRCYWKELHSPSPRHLLVRREYFHDNDYSGLHCHEDFYALYVVRGGKGTHVINGHPYAMARGDVYIMAPGAVHTYRDYRNLEGDAFTFRLRCFTTKS